MVRFDLLIERTNLKWTIKVKSVWILDSWWSRRCSGCINVWDNTPAEERRRGGDS